MRNKAPAWEELWTRGRKLEPKLTICGVIKPVFVPPWLPLCLPLFSSLLSCLIWSPLSYFSLQFWSSSLICSSKWIDLRHLNCSHWKALKFQTLLYFFTYSPSFYLAAQVFFIIIYFVCQSWFRAGSVACIAGDHLFILQCVICHLDVCRCRKRKQDLEPMQLV